MEMTLLETALSYAEKGWRVIPIQPGKKFPAGFSAWQDAATTDTAQITAWWGEGGSHPNHGIGIATGPESGIFVVDVDVSGDKRGDETLRYLIDDYKGVWPETVHDITGSGGSHYFFRYPTDGREVRNEAGIRLGPGIDIRGIGGQVLAPPTVHPVTGVPYCWESGFGPDEIDVAEPPAWLLKDLCDSPEELKLPVVRAAGPIAAEAREPGATGLADEGPAGRFNERTTWDELLVADGWVLDHTDRSGEQHWIRPGKDASGREGVSATVGHEGRDFLRVFTTSIAWLPDGSYSRFGYVACRDHAGDRSACAKAMKAVELEASRADDRAWFDHYPRVAPRPGPPSKQMKPVVELEEIEWEEPSPLKGQLIPPPFPLDALPAWMADHAKTAAERQSVPVDLCAQQALGAFSAGVTGRAKIRMIPKWTERSTGWSQHLNLWLVTAMPSGAGKTPANSAMTGALTSFEKERKKFGKRRRAEAEEEQAVMAGRLDQARSAAKKDGEVLSEVNRLRELFEDSRLPSDGRMLAGDVTPEALADIMNDHDGRMATVSSEAPLFDMVCGTYSPKTNLNIYLGGWDGGHVQVDRKGGGGSPKTEVDIQEAVLTVAVCTQPHVIAQLGLESHKELMGRGFVQRFMISLPQDRRGFRDRRRMFQPSDESFAQVYDETFLRICRKMAENQGEPVELVVSSEASDLYEDWLQMSEARIAPGGDLRHLSEWAAKQQASVGRLAGLLHLADGSDHGTAVSVDVMSRAIAVGEYWAGHASVAAEMWHSEEQFSLAGKILDTIKAKSAQVVSLRDLYQVLRYEATRPADLLPALQTLVEHGFLVPLFEGEAQTGKGKKSPEWAVNTRGMSVGVSCVSLSGESREIPLPPENRIPSRTATHTTHASHIIEPLEEPVERPPRLFHGFNPDANDEELF